MNRPSSSPEPGASRRRAAWLEAGVAFGAAVVALTCAGSGAIARARPTPEPARATASAAPVPVPRPSAREAAPTAPLPTPAPVTGRAHAPELGRFFAALESLGRRERGEPVRILWLGDSHTAADFMTGKVRELLTRRYGAGGPGFVRLGVRGYRHDVATPSCIGTFRVEPSPPARRSPQEDGVFGLGGMRVTPASDAAHFTLKVAPRAIGSGARFTVLFDLPPLAAFSASAGAETLLVDERAPRVERIHDSPILRVTLDAKAGENLSLDVKRGRPRFYGAIVEGKDPGVVLDTAGIDGARLATVLAWAEAPFVAEVAARRPDLVVVAYGTNEAFDRLNPRKYEAELGRVLGRLKAGAPQADCLVLGPPDALSPGGDSEPRLLEIAAAYQRVAASERCAFVSLQALMGGPGSFVTWLRSDPALARPDRIHYTQKGYWRLGELVAEAVLGERAALPEAKNSP